MTITDPPVGYQNPAMPPGGAALAEPTSFVTGHPPGAAVTGSGPGGLPTLAASYRICRELHRRHGTTYYWATRLLPAVSQPHVHALYGLCRYADEVVDAFDGTDQASRAVRLTALQEALIDGMATGVSAHPVLRAVVFTARAYDLPADAFERFFTAMRADLTVTRYRTYDDLLTYMDGSAAVIGELMLPILEPVDHAAALPGARDLGVAFQLTNFLRDVGEDLARGRIYLPQDELARFGIDPELRHCRVDGCWRRFCRFQIERLAGLFRSADGAIELLPGPSAAAIRTARILYAEILDRLEANDYDVFNQRARVPLSRKLHVAMNQRWLR